MTALIELLVDSPLLLLFLVAAIGYPLGRIQIGGFSLGVASVLFVGLAFGALDRRLGLPDVIYLLGLVLFVYTIGLASGHGFFASFRRRGLRDNALVAGLLLFAAGMSLVLGRLLGLTPALTAGLFCGSLTNTPALAAILEITKHAGGPGAAEPVIAYSLAYPVGAVGGILAIFVLQRRWRVDYAAEARSLRDLGASGEHLAALTIEVERADVGERTVDEWRADRAWRVMFGRYRRGDTLDLVLGDLRLAPGDRVSVVGAEPDLAVVAAFLGRVSEEHIEWDRGAFDLRRVFVSNRAIAGKRLEELRLPEERGVLVTRIRRGDLDLLPTGATRLELGDRVRVVCRRERMEKISAFFGDSYKSLSEIDIMTFGLGIALGLLIGVVPIPLPGGAVFKLGFAGGPLVVALVLGALGRTGPILWQLPYSANLTVRQIGLIFFLAGVGTRSGHAFTRTLVEGGGLRIFLAGALVTGVTSVLALWIGHRILRIPMSLAAGVLAGLSTQPTVLGYAGEQTGNDVPSIGYATVFPLATIAKILLAQILIAIRF